MSSCMCMWGQQPLLLPSSSYSSSHNPFRLPPPFRANDFSYLRLLRLPLPPRLRHRHLSLPPLNPSSLPLPPSSPVSRCSSALPPAPLAPPPAPPLQEDGGGSSDDGNNNKNTNNNDKNGWGWWWRRNPFEPDGWWSSPPPPRPFPLLFLGDQERDGVAAATAVLLFLLSLLPYPALARSDGIDASIWEVRGGRRRRLVPDPSGDTFMVGSSSSNCKGSDDGNGRSHFLHPGLESCWWNLGIWS